jgi:hypothetical protein
VRSALAFVQTRAPECRGVARLLRTTSSSAGPRFAGYCSVCDCERVRVPASTALAVAARPNSGHALDSRARSVRASLHTSRSDATSRAVPIVGGSAGRTFIPYRGRAAPRRRRGLTRRPQPLGVITARPVGERSRIRRQASAARSSAKCSTCAWMRPVRASSRTSASSIARPQQGWVMLGFERQRPERQRQCPAGDADDRDRAAADTVVASSAMSVPTQSRTSGTLRSPRLVRKTPRCRFAWRKRA